jgi:hypothetical protein
MRLRTAIAAAVLVQVTLAGCAIRYDHAGVSRVGIFLWGSAILRV